ncbi:MAG: hypothetical protein AAF503_10765 [Pseudomonadota bacterium]
MTPPWFRPLSLFVIFNLVAVPVAGRLAWDAMLRVTQSHGTLAGAGLSLVVTAAILAINVLIFRRAKAAGMPKAGQMVLFLIIGLTFATPIGTGKFSPVNLIIDLLRHS